MISLLSHLAAAQKEASNVAVVLSTPIIIGDPREESRGPEFAVHYDKSPKTLHMVCTNTLGTSDEMTSGHIV